MAEIDAQAFLENLSKRIDGFMYSGHNDADYTMSYMSEGFERLLGYSSLDFENGAVSIASLIHSDDLPRVDAAVADAIAANSRWQVSYRLKTASGNWKHVFETGGGRSDDNGEVEFLDGIIIDFGRMHDLIARLEAGDKAMGSIDQAVARIIAMLRTLRLLALNARIEAARAGDAGLSFSGPAEREFSRGRPRRGDYLGVTRAASRSGSGPPTSFLSRL